ncbi:M20 aminoacylase family protein [Sphingomonas flavalba]|uniref:M20 aminoacylase family protein n=1 Tax=Sphingomonas flavalba TaxID=2559804 RepID=UPI00109E3372|nr:M20 aminoacylase family protein [Sphingomonas flavalba]
MHDELIQSAGEWRRDIHQHPELDYDVLRTADKVTSLLVEFGCDRVETGIGKSGVVGVVHGRNPQKGPNIAIRADMDALPIVEESGVAHASTRQGMMHACGHDGHTAMLLGAAKALAAERHFDGTLVLIFQPAEEGGGGARAMIEDGLFDRFEIDEIYGLHNWPSLEIGRFMLSPGPVLMASDRFTIELKGPGGHAARPHECVDVVLASSQLVSALHTIIPRNLDASEQAVLSVTSIHGGDAFNVLPGSIRLRGTVRTLSPHARDLCQSRVEELAEKLPQAFGAIGEVSYVRGYPPTINHAKQAKTLADAAARLVGEEAVERNMKALAASEDFSFFLEKKPGAFIFMGNGQTAPLHHPRYDFNDEALPHGIALWRELIQGGRS